MRVEQVMTSGCECIEPERSVSEAARRMRALDVGSLPVCDDDRLVGMITDRDIVLRIVADGKDATERPVRDAMSTGVSYCYTDDAVSDAAGVMQAMQIRRLPVLDRERRLVGIVSLGDLATEIEDDELVGDTLGRISEPVARAAPMLAIP